MATGLSYNRPVKNLPRQLVVVALIAIVGLAFTLLLSGPREARATQVAYSVQAPGPYTGPTRNLTPVERRALIDYILRQLEWLRQVILTLIQQMSLRPIIPPVQPTLPTPPNPDVPGQPSLPPTPPPMEPPPSSNIIQVPVRQISDLGQSDPFSLVGSTGPSQPAPAVYQRPADLATANIVAFATHFAPEADLAQVVQVLNQQPSVINTLYIERPHPGEAAWTEVTSQRKAAWRAVLVPQANHFRVWSVHRPTATYYQPVEESVWYEQSFWSNLLTRVRLDTQALPNYAQNQPWTGLDLEMYGDNERFANHLDLNRLRQVIEPLRGTFDVCLPYWPGQNIQAEAALLSDVLCLRHVYPGYYDWPWRIDPVPTNGIIQLLVTLDGRLFEDVAGQVTYTPARVVQLARTRGNIMIWPIDDPVLVAQAIINASR